MRCSSSRKAVDKALAELERTRYEGCNIVLADAKEGYVIHADEEVDVAEMQQGLNIIGARDLNDPRDQRVAMARRLLTLQTLDSPVKFLAVASKVFSRGPSGDGRPSMVLRGNEHGTVSSSLIALGVKPRDAIYQFSSGPPDTSRYEDYSPLLRDILSRGLLWSLGLLPVAYDLPVDWIRGLIVRSPAVHQQVLDHIAKSFLSVRFGA